VRRGVHFRDWDPFALFYFFQFFEGGTVDAVEVSGVALEVFEDVGFVRQSAPGEGHSVVWRKAGILAGDGRVVELGLECGEAAEAPAGGDDGSDEVNFAGRARAEMDEIGVEQGAEFVFGFSVEDDVAGGDAVGAGRILATGESLGCFGASGACSIGSRGIDAALRGHGGWVSPGRG